LKGNGGTVAAGRDDAANVGDRDAGDLLRNAGRGGGGEEEFVVFAAMKRLGLGCSGVDWELRGVDFGRDIGFITEVDQVSGEAVAEIDGSRGERAALEPKALCDAGLGIKVRSEESLEPDGDSRRVRGRSVRLKRLGQLGEAGEGGGGSAEAAGDVDQVTGKCAGSKQGFAVGSCADKDDVGDGDGRFGKIAAGEWSLVSFGEGEEAVEEALDPSGASG
jgi:hypothetical protein